MALTRSFKDLVQSRVESDPAFGAALLREGVDVMLSGDVDGGKAILRDYIKATVGFEKLGEATGTQPKSLIRMFGPRGNPQARNLFGVPRLPAKTGRGAAAHQSGRGLMNRNRHGSILLAKGGRFCIRRYLFARST